MNDSRCIVVMAREPRSGAVKTRLARAIGDERAAALYEAFLRDTIATCAGTSADVIISFANDAPRSAAFFARIAPSLTAVPQPNGDFGARLSAGIAAGFAAGHTRVAVVGSDIPHMASGWIDDAFALLDDADMALGPAHDGGYYLMALRQPEPRLFRGIDWSSGREFAQTLTRARECGLRVALVETTFDIDNEADLDALRARIAAEGAAICPLTVAALASMPAVRGGAAR